MDNIVIPAGWTFEDIKDRGQTLLMTPAPQRYMTTIDWERRGFRSGYCTYGRLLNNGSPTGRGWKQRLVDEAVVFLEGLLK
jgi:hypothetical protein